MKTRPPDDELELRLVLLENDLKRLVNVVEVMFSRMLGSDHDDAQDTGGGR